MRIIEQGLLEAAIAKFTSVLRTWTPILCLSLLPLGLCAQGTPENTPSEPDALIFTNGEKLIGRFVRSDGDSVVFQSESLGEITVKWSKIRNFESKKKFAVIDKEMNLRKGEDTAKIPQGSLSIRGENLVIENAEGREQTFPIAVTEHVVDQKSFENSIRQHDRFLEGWKGGLTAALSIVQATQSSQTYTSLVNLTRAVPQEDWLATRQRTIVRFNSSFGTLKQPNSRELRTEIFHADAEHDIYLTRRFFMFAQTAFDHNLSQGLDLAHRYDGGVGLTVLKTEFREFDLRASIGYLKQQFIDPAQNQNLVSSVFAQSYTHRFPRRMTLVQRFTITPAWNNLSAYSATGDVTLIFPLYQRLTFSVGLMDTFINNPSPGFQKNSFRATTGITYTLK